ncbi:hypothetical protein JTE90_025615 [Oedothorax gibbosus]|uniref:MAP3K12-binding inhibitory protein 1 n=1 Tax=Oedothorax gibbosus TaxID=931172 RepID=A0AAV6V9E9_9ARAC|nr:hypothetical protein JTE90_025615 [Oedothorax gibbosus]
MELCENIFSTVDRFLKEIQRIEIIKDYTFQPMKLNEENVRDLKAIVRKFAQDINTEAAIQDIAEQSTDVDIENVSSDAEPNRNLAPFNKKNIVQIQVDENEIKRRISAFVNRKRKEVDEWNVQEFCSRPYIDEQNPVWEQMDSCARVDAVFIPRFGSKSHVKVSKVENRWGPQTQGRHDPAKRIKVEPDTETTSDVTFEVMQDRLLSMEAHLNLKADSTIRNSLFQRIKLLEDRILYLEGISPDYLQLSGTNCASPKKKNIQEKEKAYSNWSIDDIQKRILSLKESLKAKASVKKELVT